MKLHIITLESCCLIIYIVTDMIHSTVKAATAKEKDNDRSLNSHIITLHRRLLHSLNLGTRSQPNSFFASLNSILLFIYLFVNVLNRYFDEKTNRWKWQCVNIEVQKNVLRSIAAFLDSISADARATRHSIVKVLFAVKMNKRLG